MGTWELIDRAPAEDGMKHCHSFFMKHCHTFAIVLKLKHEALTFHGQLFPFREANFRANLPTSLIKAMVYKNFDNSTKFMHPILANFSFIKILERPLNSVHSIGFSIFHASNLASGHS